MSTEHQQYSLQNQSAVIQEYARAHGFIIVRSYSDAAKSGLWLHGRSGLKQLLADVVSPNPPFRAILTYDVSRWGRFQDIDEAAHYEYVCRAAGATVHYCAEEFPNDGSMPSKVLKGMKRIMAAEYSRELGKKVRAGIERLARMGYHVGSQPGYGLVRMMVREGNILRELKRGEYKAFASDHVILHPGPEPEIEVVRRMFSRAMAGIGAAQIARELVRDGVPYRPPRQWTGEPVQAILTNPKYAGATVWGKSTHSLSERKEKNPPERWVRCAEACEPIVDMKTFETVQKKRAAQKPGTDADILQKLTRLLKKRGRLSAKVIEASKAVPSLTLIRMRFGSLARLYDLIGYCQPSAYDSSVRFRTMQALRERLVIQVQQTFPDAVQVIRRKNRRRPLLQFDGQILVSVVLCSSTRNLDSAGRRNRRWVLYGPGCGDDRYVTLLCLLNPANTQISRMIVLSGLTRRTRLEFGMRADWLLEGSRIDDLSELRTLVIAASN